MKQLQDGKIQAMSAFMKQLPKTVGNKLANLTPQTKEIASKIVKRAGQAKEYIQQHPVKAVTGIGAISMGLHQVTKPNPPVVENQKEYIKTILMYQLNECKIEPMEYIEYSKFVDRMTNEQVSKVAGAIQTRYPKAINNMNAKIQGLERQRIQNPSQSLLINKKISKLRAIQNKYRVKQLAWQSKAMAPVSK
jgi:hypothetical protein